MLVRVAEINEIDRIMEIISDGREALAALGIDQWQGGYPDRAAIEGDLSRGESFVAVLPDGSLAATAMISLAGEATYDSIDGAWLTDSVSSDPGYVVVHRIATAKEHRKTGAAGAIVSEAERRAKALGKRSVRIDTHPGNLPMQSFLAKNGFARCGTILLADPNEPTRERIAYEKVL